MYHQPITARAVEAIIGQLCRKGHRELECAAMIEGEEVIWTAFFEEEEDAYYGVNEDNRAATRCRLVGAYDSECQWAGNRDEIAAMLGDATVTRWENQAEEEANE
jgi:hypothetical protein